MATRVIDDTKLQNIAVAIQGKDSGGTMTVDEMPTRIEALSADALVAMGIDNNGLFFSNDPDDNEDLTLGEDANGIYLEKEVA